MIGWLLLFAWPLWCKGSIRACGALGRGSIPRCGPSQKHKSVTFGLCGIRAEVAQHGQRRRIEVPIS